MPCLTGVYRIRNKRNGKVYIGSTGKTFKGRWVIHLCELRQGIHVNRHLQSAWNKYGEVSFAFEVVEECRPKYCLRLEQYWMDKTKAADSRYGYNILPIAGSPLGTKQTPETIAKVVAFHTGRKRSAAFRAQMSKSQRSSEKCKKHRKEKLVQAAAEANRNRQYPPKSEATKENMREAARKRWADPTYRAKMVESRRAEWARRKAENASPTA